MPLTTDLEIDNSSPTSGVLGHSGNLNRVLKTIRTNAEDAEGASENYVPGRTGSVSRARVGKDEERIDLRDFITDTSHATIRAGTNANDMSSSLQAHVDACIAERFPGRWPWGRYVISSPVFITDATFDGVDIIGDGRGYTSSSGLGSNRGGTVIDHSALTTRPGLVINFCRGVKLADFAMKGPNLAPAILTAGNQPTNVAADWLTAGVRDNRYSPQCAIAVDATTGNDPGGSNGYPGMSYAAIPGSGSADISFHRLLLRDTNIGIMFNPNIVSVQGDQVTVFDCLVHGAHIAYAWGQSQSNANNIIGGNIEHTRRAFDGVTYGMQQGAVPLVVGTHVNEAYSAFAFADTQKGGGFYGLFAESMKMLGTYGAGGTVIKRVLVVSGLRYYTRSTTWDRPPFILENHGPMLLDGADIANNDAYQYAVSFGGDGPLEIRGLSVNVQDSNKPLIGLATDLSKPIQIRSARAFDATVAAPPIAQDGPPSYSLPARVVATRDTRSVADVNGRYNYRPVDGNAYRLVGLSVSSIVVNSGARTIAFTIGAATDILVGDILLWPMLAVAPSAVGGTYPALRITTIATLAVTCSMIDGIDPALYDSTYPGLTGAGVLVAQHEWAPGADLRGDLNSSTSITGVTPTTIVKNGDWLKAAAGLHANARVVSGQGTATLVLNRAATATTANVKLYGGKLVVPSTTDLF